MLIPTLLAACAVPGDAWHGALPALRVDPAQLDFGVVALGSSTTSGVSLVNDGAVSVAVRLTDDGPFSVDRPEADVAAHSAVELTVRFAPLGYDRSVGELLVESDDAWIAVSLHGDTDPDSDADGAEAVAAGGTDCDDADATVHPGAVETWYDGVDQDCDGNDDDQDVDGTPVGTDCDDTDATVAPGAAEVTDDRDDDCDGMIDEHLYTAGALVLSEVHLAYPPYVELCSTAATTLHLDGLTLDADAGPLTLDAATVPADTCVALCRSTLDDCALHPELTLGATADTLTLRAGELVVDSLAWDETWPDDAGKTWLLDAAHLDATANDDRANWCVGTGSPGVPNAACP